VIDLARLLSGFCAGLVDNSIFFDALLRAAELSTDNAASPSSKAKETNALLFLRTVANALQEGTKIGDGGWIKEVSCHSTYSSSVVRSRTAPTWPDFRNSGKRTV
jgi:phospholipase A-2-activating protein